MKKSTSIKQKTKKKNMASNLPVSRSVAEFAFKMSVAMENIASSNVFFMMQQAYGEDTMYDYRLCQEKWKTIQDELRQHFC